MNRREVGNTEVYHSSFGRSGAVRLFDIGLVGGLMSSCSCSRRACIPRSNHRVLHVLGVLVHANMPLPSLLYLTLVT